MGKTATARRRAQTVYALDDPAVIDVLMADPRRLAVGAEPVLIDEWQRYPASWDIVRRAIDDDVHPGRFILTGSATPGERPTHSGAGRIVRVRMRPLTLAERGLEVPTVSMAALLRGDRAPLQGYTDVGITDYVDEILTGGFPGMRSTSPRLQRRALDGYLDRIADADLPELGVRVRHPGMLRRWMAAYAAATSSTASFESIRDAATGGFGEKPAKSTTIPYREALERIWILEPVGPWIPSSNALSRLTQAPKHHLADPALAARLVGADRDSLLAGQPGSAHGRKVTLLGALFESLATLSVRVFAQPEGSTVSHFRTRAGEREVDLIVEDSAGRIVAIEVKLSDTVTDADVRHLNWLSTRPGVDVLDAIVITTGSHAYRRPDGIGVVPLALLGP